MYANPTMPANQVHKPAAPLAADGSFDRAPIGYRAYLKRISAQMLEVQESERRRVATDLHDGLGQSLTMIKHAIDESALLLDRNMVEETSESLRHLKLKVKNALDELHSIALDLRPAMLDDLGVLSTLSWYFREFEADCRDIKVEKHFRVPESSIPVPLRIVIFRIIQEATSNIVKHAHASRVWVTLEEVDDTLRLTVEDDGNGFDAAVGRRSDSAGKGFGLLSMAERARLYGGRYSLESAIGHGTRIEASWPLGLHAK